MTARAPKPRILAGILAALWIVVPVASAVHGAIEAHQFCVEHQAFEHESHGHEHAEDGTQVHAQHEAGDDHAACAFDDAALRNAPPALADIAVVVPPATTATATAPAAHGPAADVLAAAPKTSPPLLPTA